MSLAEFLPITGATLAIALLTAAQILVIVRAILRPHRDPASRIAWVAVIGVLPLVGMTAYLLFGETSIGSRRLARRREIEQSMPACQAGDAAVPDTYAHLARLGTSINALTPAAGNRGCLLSDSNRTTDALVADIEAATSHVHLLFYIWLPDHNGLKVARALMAAARRGVNCRVMADSLGSRPLLRSATWRDMEEAGVRTAVALPISRMPLRVFRSRIDLRNHRKLVVIDDHITYCGSQNCADPEFLIKAKFAPWVDIVVRLDGPVARQNQHLFATDWTQATGEDLGMLLQRPPAAGAADGFAAQVIGTGPTARHSAMPEVFSALLHTARDEVTATTPYYVPDEPLQRALCATALRGVTTTLIVPARNDSWIVAAASRSYYGALLEAGVSIHEYQPGLLHAKSLTVDGQVCLLGSANMDRRSFELNYENNVLLFDPAITAEVYQRQLEFLQDSTPVANEQVAGWTLRRRLWNNTVAMLGPLL